MEKQTPARRPAPLCGEPAVGPVPLSVPRPGSWPVAPDGAVHVSVARATPSKGRPRARSPAGTWPVKAGALSWPVARNTLVESMPAGTMIGPSPLETLTLPGPVTGTGLMEAGPLSRPLIGTRIDPPKAEAWSMARPLLPRSPVSAVIAPVAEIFAPVADVLAPIEEVFPPVASVLSPVEEVFPTVPGDVVLQTIDPALKPLCELGIALADGLIICILDALESPSLDPVVAPVEEILPAVPDVLAPIEEVFPPVEAVLPPVAPPLQALLLHLVDERRVYGVGLGQARGLLGGPARRRQHQGHEGGQHQDDAPIGRTVVDTHGIPPFIESE